MATYKIGTAEEWINGHRSFETILSALVSRMMFNRSRRGWICYIYDDKDNLIHVIDCSHLKKYKLISYTELSLKIKTHIQRTINDNNI